MKQESTSRAVSGIGIIAAIAASLCCITPVLALMAGVSGAASSLSWLEPARPLLVVLAVTTLGYAWYRSLRSKKDDVCAHDGTCTLEKKSFLASRAFLVILTIAAITLITFPYYAHLFYPKPVKQNIPVAESSHIQTAYFTIKGMTCKGCEAEVNHEIHKVPGVIDAQTFYHKGLSIVKFDSTKASRKQLQSAIENTSYSVIDIK